MAKKKSKPEDPDDGAPDVDEPVVEPAAEPAPPEPVAEPPVADVPRETVPEITDRVAVMRSFNEFTGRVELFNAGGDLLNA